MADLTLIHTAEVHVGTFDRLAARIAPDIALCHIVRPNWLARAQTGIDADLSQEITQLRQSISGPVLCSCTSLGPLADVLDMTRIDRPMMKLAGQSAGGILLTYCVASTRTPSLDLLSQNAWDTGRIEMLDLTALWPLFETGQSQEFHRNIALEIDAYVAENPCISTVVLAQASMAGAANLCQTTATVLASPETALRAALGMD